MKQILSITTGLLCLLTGIANGQSKQEWIEFGDQAYKNENYGSAAYFYLQVFDKSTKESIDAVYPYELTSYQNPNKSVEMDSLGKAGKKMRKEDSYVIHKLAASYFHSHDYEKAEDWYSKAVQYPSDQFPYDKYWYAVSLMRNEKYDEAISLLEGLKKEYRDSSGTEMYGRINKGLMGCYFAQDQGTANKLYTIEKLDSTFNKGVSNYAPNYYGNENTLVFSSGRPGNIITDEKEQDPNFRSDFYTTTQVGGNWVAPQNMGDPVNTDINEGAGVLSVDKKQFYFTRWSPTSKNEASIYLSRFLMLKWLDPLKLNENVNAPGYKSIHPSLNYDASILYFSSNRPGGEGGMDIWYCELDNNGNPMEPKNMGSLVNTPGDEVSPYFHYPTQTLFFSSDGHVTIGGLDILSSNYDEIEDSWSAPKNIGKPINSSRDDAHFIMNIEQGAGYFSSDRNKCEDCEDEYRSGYCYSLYSYEKKKNVFSISGIVVNAETDEVIPNALITFKDIRGEEDPFFITTNKEGEYATDLKQGQELYMKAQKVKFFGDAAAVTTKGLTQSKHFIQDFFLSPIPVGEVEIPGIEYDYDKATLRPKSKKILDDLVEFLQLNDNLVVEIAAHTDTRGGDAYNMRLSEDRAQSVVDYLVANGIDRSRLLPKGYGESKLLVEDAETEEEHQKNRRTTFTTLSQDFIDIEERKNKAGE